MIKYKPNAELTFYADERKNEKGKPCTEITMDAKLPDNAGIFRRSVRLKGHVLPDPSQKAKVRLARDKAIARAKVRLLAMLKKEHGIEFAPSRL